MPKTNQFLKKIKKNPFILAPMDEITDLPFRELCEKTGASYTTTELTSCDALIRDKVIKTRYDKGELKFNVVQLFGNNPNTFLDAAKKLDGIADAIDINFGCPSQRLINNNCGASLLKDPKNVSQIIEKLVKHTNLPISAKIRLGYEKTNHKQIAKEIENAGANLLTIHGRTAKQGYSGNADWTAIQEIFNSAKIPIVGNGDIKQEEDIDKYLNTHANALMIGRAATGNPLIFKKFNHYLKTGQKLEIQNKKETQREQLQLYINQIKNRKFHNLTKTLQHQSMFFLKGIEGAPKLREKLNNAKDIETIKKIVNEF